MTEATGIKSLVETSREQADQQPDRTAYTFLEDGKREGDRLTYRQLDQKARTIATYLQAQLAPGDRVLLAYPQRLEAIAAVLGCFYAGMVAIPAPAPEPSRLKCTLPRLEAIAADAGAAMVLTTTRLLTQWGGSFIFQAKSVVGRVRGRSALWLHYYLSPAEKDLEMSHLASLPWVGTDTIPAHMADQWQARQISGDTLAYLQYTSGSTSTPKGVMLDHANLMGHLAALQQAGGYDSNSVTVTWMPYFHDYGLVEGMLLPLYNGTPCYMMSPTAFIKQPLRWLNAISRYGATHSQAPNFAYAYCLRRITPAERNRLDLSRWQAAGNAAEPISPDVMEQFCQIFAACGFARQAFAPAYGLAEATLLVTTSRKSDAPVFCTVDGGALAQNRVVETATGQRLAGSGKLLTETNVAIVHPETLTRCALDEVGEICVASAGVARGYWQRLEATRETFSAYLADTGAGPFLRTGDLGFIKDGELFVTGRLKDLIIIRGENYYPQDIEWVVEKSHPALRPNYGAAFAVETDDGEQLVIAFEVERRASQNLDAVGVAMRNAVAEHFELPVYGVVLLKRGSIPKTSSGKIQRGACRQAFLAGDLEVVASWDVSAIRLPSEQQSREFSTSANLLNVKIAEIWREILEVESVSGPDNFFELGGSSLQAATVIAEVERFGLSLSLGAIAEAPTLEKFTNLIHRKQWNFFSSRSLVPLRTHGTKKPLFIVHHIGGDVMLPLLASHLDADRPVYGLKAVGLEGEQEPFTQIKPMVNHYIREIRTVQPHGSYLLAGTCIGGNIAIEMAQQLQRDGESVSLVVMIDSPNPLLTKQQRERHWQRWLTVGKQNQRNQLLGLGLSQPKVETILKVRESNHRVWIYHTPTVYAGRVAFLSGAENATRNWQSAFDPMQPGGWNEFVFNGLEVYRVPGDHRTMHFEVELAERLNTCLESTHSNSFTTENTAF